MASLSLAMIVKNEGETIERVLGCARAFADELVVVDTGSSDDTVAKATAMGAVVHHFEWVDDFAAARNHAFAQCTQDWIMWLDGDDWVAPEHQQRIAALKTSALDSGLEAVYLRYNYPPFRQWRERIVRRDLWGARFQWREPVHECIHGIDNARAAFLNEIEVEHCPPPDRLGKKSGRNIGILRKHVAAGARDERSLYMYAVECLHSLLRDEAQQVLPMFLATVNSKEYRYEVLCKQYDFHLHFGEPAPAVDALAQAIACDPARAEAYYKLGRHQMQLRPEHPGDALPLLAAAGMCKLPGYGTPEAEAYEHGPFDALASAHLRLEQFAQAQAAAQRALQFQPPRQAWLLALARCRLDAPPFEPLPPQWHEWAVSNLARGVPRPAVIATLEDNRFTPAQIITTLRAHGPLDSASR